MGTSPFAEDPLSAMYQRCMVANGFDMNDLYPGSEDFPATPRTPPGPFDTGQPGEITTAPAPPEPAATATTAPGPGSWTGPTAAQKAAWTRADAACADFADTSAYGPTNEWLDCLAANGLVVNLRAPWPPDPIGTDLAARLHAACKDKRGPESAPPGFQEYSDCLADKGYFIGLPVPVEGHDRPPPDSCPPPGPPADSVSPPMTVGPPEVATWMDCLTAQGVDTASRPGLDPETAVRVWAACKDTAPPRPPSPYMDCLDDSGIIQMLPVEYPPAVRDAAERACADEAMAEMPTEVRAMYECLTANGVDPPTKTGEPKMLTVGEARRVYEACKDTAPEPPDGSGYQDCMANHDVFIMLPLPVGGVDYDAANRACAHLMPKPQLPVGIARWHQCLADHGLEIPETGEPDFDAARKAINACADLKPTGVFGLIGGGPMSGYSPIPAATIAVPSQPPPPTTTAPAIAR